MSHPTNPTDDPALVPITIPILRTFPGPEARRFYVEYLGFTVDWQHRFGEGMPLYQQVSRSGCVLHLSEHHGDGTPGTAVRIQISDTRSLQQELLESAVYPLRIGLEHEPWGDELVVPDPFGNRIIFHTPVTPPVLVTSRSGRQREEKTAGPASRSPRW